MPAPRTSPASARPLFWPAITRTDAKREWDELRIWVEDYINRFAIDSRTIPSCWYRHNPMVEALAALRDHEQASYEYPTSKTAGVDFIHAASYIATVLREHAARTGCGASGHRADPAWRPASDPNDWQRFLDTDAALDAADEPYASPDDDA